MIDSFSFFKEKALVFRKTLGAIIIASVAYMIYSEGGMTLTPSPVPQVTLKTAKALEDGLWNPYPAPEIAGIDTWINSPPLTLAALKGKVVLIDFWTYSCINCIRTLPYLIDWYSKYQKQGLVIIGVHSPEFDFEKNLNNVKAAVTRYGIKYPVALDNRFETWSNFQNHYWPAHYLINKEGQVVYVHTGEGAYAVTENNIRFLLGIDDLNYAKINENQSYSYNQTPETYLGYLRANSQAPYLVRDKITFYQFPAELAINAWGLEGAWQVNEDKIVSAKANAALKIHFNARKVFLVMGNNGAKAIRVNLLLNGERLISDRGSDVKNSSALVTKHSIYEIVNATAASSGVLKIIATEPGLEIYTFTFGN